jgi:hypothetical protein
MPAVRIGRIEPRNEACLLQMMNQIGVRKGEQRADEVASNQIHPSQAGGPRPSQHPHQHSLNLIVGVMRRKDDPGANSATERLEPGIPLQPRPRLAGARAKLQAANMDRETIRHSEGSYLLRHPAAVHMDPVVHVRDYQVELVQVSAMDEKVEQGDGVGPTRYGNDGRAPGQAQAREMEAERLEESHGTKLNGSVPVEI